MLREKTDRERLIESNMGLVHACAARFREKGIEYDDLFQAGCVGLIKAADGFDRERGFLFSTYAVPVILGEIKRLFREGGTVKVGRGLKEKSREVMREKERLEAALGREATIGELSAELNMEVAETSFVLNAAMPVLSLTVDDGEGGNSQCDIPVPSPEDEISNTIALEKVIADLDERDRQLIELRYYEGLTQSRTAQHLGMSQVQVSRREKVILSKVRLEMSG